MPQKTIDLLNEGTDVNKSDRFRQNNLICLPANGSVIVAGDLHGHKRNFERIVSFSDLENNSDRHVILQEIIHGGPEDSAGRCLSYQLLFEVVGYKIKFPDQVHIIMGNHATAFINNSEVMKNGKEMNRSMRMAIEKQFIEFSENIVQAIKEFMLSEPLAVRTENKIWMSHSLPSDRTADKFDCQIFARSLKTEDLTNPGSVYLLTWGRNQSQKTLDKMAEIMKADFFILGHQPQQEGWGQIGKNAVILASEHNHGCLMNIELAKSYTMEELIKSIVPLASIK